jgi:integrase/recombinase XerD
MATLAKHGTNSQHKVLDNLPAIAGRDKPLDLPAVLAAGDSLANLAGAYFISQVAGQSANTISAKKRDLQRFLDFYVKLYGHDDPAEWYTSVTREFLKTLTKDKLGESSRGRVYSTVRHFARWIHARVKPFALGCPTDGVKAPAEPEPEWKGLSRADELRLLSAAQSLRLTPGRGTDQGLRNHAAVATLLGCGLRVTELLSLDVSQYDGKSFTKVVQKGGHVRKFVPVAKDAREVLDEWVKQLARVDGSLFPTRSGKQMSRVDFYQVVQRIASVASARLTKGQLIDVTPHVLRHTFLRKLAEAKGVQYAKEASGHRSDKYIWRYVKPDEQTLADAIDDLD